MIVLGGLVNIANHQLDNKLFGLYIKCDMVMFI